MKLQRKPSSRIVGRFILIITALMVVGLLALFSINSMFMRNTLYDHVITAMQQQQALYARDINARLLEAEQTAFALKTALTALPSADDFFAVAVQFTEAVAFIENVFIGFNDGTIINGTGWGINSGIDTTGIGWIPEENWTPMTRPWFVDAVAAGAHYVVVTEPYLSHSSGNMTTAMAVWAPDMQGVGAVVGFSMDLHFLLDTLYDHPVMGDGKLMLVCCSGSILFHTNPAYSPTQSGIFNLHDIQGGSFIAYNIDAGNSLAFYGGLPIGEAYINITPLAACGWYLISMIPEEITIVPVYQDLYPIMVLLLIVLIVFFGGVAVFIVYLLRLVEKRRAQEEELRLNIVREQEAGWAKSRFLSNMSHEIRTPLNAIKSMTHFAKRASDAKSKDSYIDKVEDASAHLVGIINQILDMSQIEAGKFYLVPHSFEFMKMMNGIKSFMNEMAATQEIKLEIDIDPTLPRHIVADERRLAQVITNLLSNAIKFTPTTGEVNLRVERAGAENLRVVVSDTGVGISHAEQATLFEPFEQAEEGRKTGGTGLGLAISKEIITMMGGEISVESAKGAGAVFTFTVPLTEDKNEGDANAAKWDAFCVNCFEGKVFLLAEDVETNREIFKTLMADSGAEIICAQNGEEAVNIFENSPGGIDLIIMDVQMPRMNGLDATRLLRGNGATVPIIAFTANVFREDIDECISAGMNDHLGKPLDTEEVYRKIGRLLA